MVEIALLLSQTTLLHMYLFLIQMVLISEKVKDQIEAIIEQLGEDQDKSSIKSKKSSSSSSEHGTENDEADTGNGLRHSIYIRTVSS